MADEEIQGGKQNGGLGGIKLIIIVAAIAVLVGAGGFFLGKMLSGGGETAVEDTKTEDAANPEGTEQKDGEQKSEKQEGVAESEGSENTDSPGLMVLEKFTVNLNDPFGRRYAEILINLKIEKKSTVSKIQAHELLLPQIRDEIFMIISSKSYPELNSVSGKITLKEEIMIRVNELIKESLGVEPVQDVFFGTFIIQ